MKFPRLIGLVLIAIAAAVGTACNEIDGDGRPGAEDRDLAGFDSVGVSDALTADITLAPDLPQAVRVSGDDNLIGLVRTTVVDRRLIVDFADHTSFDPRLPLVVTISATALRGVAAADAAHLSADAVAGDDVAIDCHDAATVTVDRVTAAASATIDVASASMVDVAHGDTPVLAAAVTDASTLGAGGLRATAVTVSASRGSTAHVCATASLDATATTGSHVGYQCAPAQIVRHVDVSSSLTPD